MCKHLSLEASLNPWANIIDNHQEETLAHRESHFTNTCIEVNSVFSANQTQSQRPSHVTKEANAPCSTSPSVNFHLLPPQCTAGSRSSASQTPFVFLAWNSFEVSRLAGRVRLNIRSFEMEKQLILHPVFHIPGLNLDPVCPTIRWASCVGR